MMDYRAIAAADAQKYGIDPGIFVRQIDQESGFQPWVVSPAGAVGIAQIMPATAKGWGVDPTDPVASLDAAAYHDKLALDQYGGSWPLALAAYNAGGGAVAQYGGVPPYPETIDYVNTILGGGSAGVIAATGPQLPNAPPAALVSETKTVADAALTAAAITPAAIPLPTFAFPTLPNPHIAGGIGSAVGGAVLNRLMPYIVIGVVALLVIIVVASS